MSKKNSCKKKNNICGIVGLVFSFLSPIIGATLGIIALAREERSPWIGITAIAISFVNFLIGFVLLMSVM